MKLSEAIRLGAMMRPLQARGSLYAVQSVHVPGDVLSLNTERVASCAFGAAYEAAGIRSRWAVSDGTGLSFRGEQQTLVKGEWTHIITTPEEWWKVLSVPVTCPCLCEIEAEVLRMIPHLNDHHEWTRERISDWVATVEPLEVGATPDAVVTGSGEVVQSVHARL